MKKYINDSGSECFKGVSGDSAFDKNLFYLVPDQYNSSKSDVQYAFHTNLGSLTVLDRMTGFGVRDTETGFRDNDGKCWLATGGRDVRKSGSVSINDAISWVKSNATYGTGLKSNGLRQH